MSLPGFLVGHAAHPDAHMALALAAAPLQAQVVASGLQPTLGWVYLTDHHAAAADALVEELRLRWPGVDWVGCVGIGVAVSGVEYFDEPALVLMLGSLPREDYLLFHGAKPLPAARVQAALVHADPRQADLAELIEELAQRCTGAYLFGGLCASRGRDVQICAPADDPLRGVVEGGISGVGFMPSVALRSRLTQGCQPVGPQRRITAAQDNVVLALDGRPALPLLLGDLGIGPEGLAQALPKLRGTLVGLTDGTRQPEGVHRGHFGLDTRVRHLIGLDPARAGVAVAERVEVGMQLAFCRRDVQAARLDLVRMAAELRDELCPAEFDGLGDGQPLRPEDRVAGAIYVSCSGRGGPHFGGPSAEMQILRHALGEVPLVGFFAAGEIAHDRLHGYTGVLTLFLRD